MIWRESFGSAHLVHAHRVSQSLLSVQSNSSPEDPGVPSLTSSSNSLISGVTAPSTVSRHAVVLPHLLGRPHERVRCHCRCVRPCLRKTFRGRTNPSHVDLCPSRARTRSRLRYLCVQCSSCLRQWASVSRTPSCPLCRSVVEAPLIVLAPTNRNTREAEHSARLAARAAQEALEERLAAQAEVEARAAELVRAAQAAGRHHAVPTIRERVEAEHQQRSAARARVLEFERRVESYMSFTPSGRPYDDLPIVALSDVREVHKENKRNSACARAACQAVPRPVSLDERHPRCLLTSPSRVPSCARQLPARCATPRARSSGPSRASGQPLVRLSRTRTVYHRRVSPHAEEAAVHS